MQFIINLLKKLFFSCRRPNVEAESEPQDVKTQNVKPVEPEVIMGGNTINVEGAKMQEPKKISTILTINNSKNFSYYTQRNNEVTPTSACNVTSMIMGLLYNKLIYNNMGRWYNRDNVDLYELNKDQLPSKPYTQIEDNLIYFCQHSPDVLSMYEKTYPNLYMEWKNELDELKRKGVKYGTRVLKSYCPNEMHLVLSYATNLFVGLGSITQYETQGIDTIIKRIKNGESVVVSGLFEGLNHIVCVCGLQYEQETGKTYSFIIDDPWYRTLHYKDKKTGDDSIVLYDEFIKYVKPLDNKEKACHIFKR